MTLDDIPINVAHEDPLLREACEREYRERVTEVQVLSTATLPDEAQAMARLRREGRISTDRYPGLDWSDLDDLLDPTLDDDRGSRVGP